MPIVLGGLCPGLLDTGDAMTDRELMQMALDALENYKNVVTSSNDPQDFGGVVDGGEPARSAIKALHARLAQPEPEPVVIGEEWKPCVKLPIVVHVREQRKGETHISTREGITPVKEDDLIMRGVAGEEYPIGRELFNRTYTFDTAPVHAIDISEKRVDETAKDRHEPVPNYYDKSIHDNPDAQAWAKFFMATVKEKEWCIDDIDENLMLGWFANAMMAMHDHVKREWVGLTDEEKENFENMWDVGPLQVEAIETKLKEKNT